MSHAIELLKHEEKFSVRPTQQFALKQLISSQKRLAEIKTGEGKSLIVAMLAVLCALKGKKIDIVTSSSELAKRDAEEQQPFYELFGLSCGHNISDQNTIMQE